MKVLHNHTLSTQLCFARREMAYGWTILIMKVILLNTKNLWNKNGICFFGVFQFEEEKKLVKEKMKN